MPLDTSSTSALINALTNPPNPLTQFGGTLDLANKIKQFQADKAISDIYGQSIDPTTGQVDLGKFNALASQNPAALWKYGDQMQQAGHGVLAQGQGTREQLQAAQDQLGAQAAYLQPLVSRIVNNKETITGAELSESLKNVPPGLIPQSSVANIQRQIAQIGPDGNANGIILGGAFANSQAREVYKSVLPNFGTIGMGGYQLPYQANPAVPGGATFPRQPLPMTPSPGEQQQQGQWLNQPVVGGWTNPKTLQHKEGSLAQWYAEHGGVPALPFGNLRAGPDGTVAMPGVGGAPGPRVVAPTAQPAPQQGGGGGAQPSVTRPTLTGRPPEPPPQQPPPTAPPPQPGGTAVPPQSTLKASEDAYNAARADMPASQNRVFTMQQALGALRGAKTGPGTEWLQTLNGVLGSWDPGVLKSIGYDPQKKAASYDEANKYLQMITNQAAGGIGGVVTNDKLASALTANPNVHIQDLAADQILKVMVAQEKMKQHIWNLAQKQNVAPGRFADFGADWATTRDPRAFILDQLPPSRIAQIKQDSVKDGKLTPDGEKLFNTVQEIQDSNAAPASAQP